MLARQHVERYRARIAMICEGLPEAEISSRTGQHSKYTVRGKTFAYYTVDHHGDGRVAMSCKAPAGLRDIMIASDSRYFMPQYLGPKGWVGLYLDVGDVDWDVVRSLLTDSYCMIAPKRLAQQVDARRDAQPPAGRVKGGVKKPAVRRGASSRKMK